MKKTAFALALAAALASAQGFCADDFGGFYGGLKAGVNDSKTTGSISTKRADDFTGGAELGYNFQTSNDIVIGADLFADYNNKSTHDAVVDGDYTGKFGSATYGGDVKLGMAFDKLMPYVKAGYAYTRGSGDARGEAGKAFHGGVGIEYKLTPNLGVNAEWLTTRPKDNGTRLVNNNYTVGLNYYFGAKAAPVVVTPAPVPAPAPAPAVAPKPVPVPVAPEPKCVDVTTTKPVRLSGANFANASAKLKPAAFDKLNDIVKAAQANTGVNFEVAGFTDSRGSAKLNQKLSQSRAQTVKQYLVAHGVNASRISAAGYGPEQPVADNATEAGRAENRRVEIRFTKNETSQRCN